VHAFEADPNIYKTLCNNVEINNLQDKIKVENKAIWINDSGVLFDVEGGYSGQIHQHGHDLVKETINIPSISLGKIIGKYDKIDFLKLDIEGAENKVLLNCHGLLERIEYIFIEWHSITNDEQYLGEILNLLKEEGFRYRHCFRGKR